MTGIIQAIKLIILQCHNKMTSSCAQAVVELADRIESGQNPGPLLYALANCDTSGNYTEARYPGPLDQWTQFGYPIPRTTFCDDSDNAATLENCPTPVIGSMVLPDYMRVRFKAANDTTPNVNPQKVYNEYTQFPGSSGTKEISNQGYLKDDTISGSEPDGKISDFVADIGQLEITSEDAPTRGVFSDMAATNLVWASGDIKDERSTKTADASCVEGANTSDLSALGNFTEDGKMIRSMVSCGSKFYPSFGAFTRRVSLSGNRWSHVWRDKTNIENGDAGDYAPIIFGSPDASLGGIEFCGVVRGTTRYWAQGPLAMVRYGPNKKAEWGPDRDRDAVKIDNFMSTECLMTKSQSQKSINGTTTIGDFQTLSNEVLLHNATRFIFNDNIRSCNIDASTRVGAFLRREYYGCSNKLAGSLDSVQVDLIAPDDGRVVDRQTWLAYFCSSNRYQLKVGNIHIRRYRPGSVACNQLMQNFCLNNNYRTGKSAQMFDHSCSCIREARKLRNFFTGVENAPIHCFIANCNAGDPNVAPAEGNNQPCNAKLCQQTIDLNSNNLLVNGVQELKCFNQTYKVTPPIDEGSQVNVPFQPDSVAKDTGAKETHGSPGFSLLFYIAVAFLGSMVILAGLYFYVRQLKAPKINTDV